MNAKEIREMMKDKYDEITFEEYGKGEGMGECCFNIGYESLCFIPKQQFPIVFERFDKKCIVYETGAIRVSDNDESIYLYDSLQVLYDAVDKSREIRKK